MPKGIESTVFPRGREALQEQPGEAGEGAQEPSAEELMAATHREVGRVQALDLAERVAAGTAKAAVEKALEQDRARRDDDAKAKEGQLRAFKSFLRSLEDLTTADERAATNTEETRLVLRLYRLEEKGGPKPTSVYQTAVTLTARDALAMVDPDLEGRAQAWSEETGRFGVFQWRLLGWAAGEQTLDTTYNVTTQAPPGYIPPKAPQAEAAGERAPDPMAQLREGLGLVSMVKEVLGGGKADASIIEATRAAARADALREADRDHREELRKLEDRWEARLEEAERKAHERGLAEGRREKEDELRPRLWELERRAERDQPPSILQEAIQAVGGPEVVQAIAKMALSNMGNPKPPAPPHRPAQAPAPMPLPPPSPAASAPPSPQEPSRKEWREALEDTEAALDILEEHDDGSQEVAQTRSVLQAFVQQGEQEINLATWWKAWGGGIGEAVRDILARFQEPDEEPHPAPQGPQGETMDMNGLKELLDRRLEEGAADDVILAELDQLTTPGTRAEWRRLLGWIPREVAAGMIAGESHRERVKGLLEAFLAG
ncbi:MAG TPA: hypothetical protein VFT46_04280 [Holophagaceae bacterium]|nr:hypothetical protein [Holophagaceae bacterium]